MVDLVFLENLRINIFSYMRNDGWYPIICSPFLFLLSWSFCLLLAILFFSFPFLFCFTFCSSFFTFGQVVILATHWLLWKTVLFLNPRQLLGFREGGKGDTCWKSHWWLQFQETLGNHPAHNFRVTERTGPGTSELRSCRASLCPVHTTTPASLTATLI